MSKLAVSEFVTIDGVFEDPGGGEGVEYGGWAFKFDRGPEGDEFKFDELMAAGGRYARMFLLQAGNYAGGSGD